MTREKDLAHGKHAMTMTSKDGNPLCNTNPGCRFQLAGGWGRPAPHSAGSLQVTSPEPFSPAVWIGDPDSVE